MKNLQELKKKIQKAVPEIMEREILYSCNICGASKKNRVNWCGLGCGRDYNEMTKVIILGRPITLEDVLVAMLKNKEPYGIALHCGNNYAYFISPKNDFVEKELFEHTNILWQLNKFLDQQSEETIKFLNEIL